MPISVNCDECNQSFGKESEEAIYCLNCWEGLGEKITQLGSQVEDLEQERDDLKEKLDALEDEWRQR